MSSHSLIGRSFSLLELVIVIVIIGIIATIAITRVGRSAENASEAALRAIVRVINNEIEMYFAKQGIYPDTIDPQWFRSGKLANPYDPDHPTPIFYVDQADSLHPNWKVVRPGSTFWYNKANGIFRGRVDDQLSVAETIALYNRANATSITTIDQRK